MSLLDKLNPLKALLEPITNLIDGLHTSDEEKAVAKQQAMALVVQHATTLEETYRTELEAQKQIIVAEIQSDDPYTRRARPTIVYAGLGAMALNHIVLPWIAFFTGAQVPEINLPSEFWLAWGGVVGVYAWGRSREKLATKSLQDQLG